MNKINVKKKKGYLEVSNHRALNPNAQGETGVVFRPETIKESVEEYKKLVESAPYYRVMLDSHVKMGEAKWADVGGIVTDVWVDSEGAARINYDVFGNTAVYDRMLVMGKIPGIGNMSLSARGYGKKVRINPAYSRESQTIKQVKMLGDSPIKYFKTLSEAKYKKSGVFMEGFILLGWDIVVAPSQIDASSLVLLNNNKTAMVRESGVIRKAFGDKEIIKENIFNELSISTGKSIDQIKEASTSLSFEKSKTVPPLRSYIVAGEEVGNIYGNNIGDMLKRWV